MTKLDKKTIITSKDQLIQDLENAAKPKNQWRIGTEHEKIIHHKHDFKRPGYFGDSGIGALLQEFITRYDWKPIYEHDNIIALEDDTKANISLEPGGQLELSGAPLKDLHQACHEAHHHLNQTMKICDDLDLSAIGIGFDPVSTRDDIQWMPKGRYKIMRDYMPKKGNLGLDMMLRTCTVQTNLDFANEQDMIEKMRISMALQPLATALFANSPFKEGKNTGYQSLRAHIWHDTDADRCGFLDFVFDKGFGFEMWIDYLLNIPMYFAKKDGLYYDMTHRKFPELMAGQCTDDGFLHATYGDWLDHMTVAFPEVRLKHYIEMRGADSSSWGNICALPSFWVGLLYDSDSQQACLDLISDWSKEDMLSCYHQVPQYGLRVSHAGRSVLEWLQDIIKIAENGLKNRAVVNSKGNDERIFLTPLRDIIANGKSNSDLLQEKFIGEWQQDMQALYTYCRY